MNAKLQLPKKLQFVDKHQKRHRREVVFVGVNIIAVTRPFYGMAVILFGISVHKPDIPDRVLAPIAAPFLADGHRVSIKAFERMAGSAQPMVVDDLGCVADWLEQIETITFVWDY